MSFPDPLFSPESLQGQCLVASRQLVDGNFWASVVLILEHHDEGASGVIINRPSSVKIADAFRDHFDAPLLDEPVHVGGPVGQNGLMVLHNSGEFDEETQQVIPGVYLGANADDFEELLTAAADEEKDVKLRIYSGCAGWGPGQLESEIGRNDWHVRPCTAEHVFADDPYAIWEGLLQEAYRANRLFPAPNFSPELN